MWVSISLCLLMTKSGWASAHTTSQTQINVAAAIMVGKSISGFPSRCTLVVEVLEPLKPAQCVGEFEGLSRGRVHLLTARISYNTKVKLQATCGLQNSAVVEVAMTQAITPWVVLRTTNTKGFSQRQNFVWKRFFGVLSLLIFTAELCFLLGTLL